MTTAHDLRLALDPAAYMEAAGKPPDPWQVAVARSQARRSLLMCCRQAGKSTTIAAIASHTAIYNRNALVLVLAGSQQQSRETYRKILEFHRDATDVEPEHESVQRLEMPNGSRIVSLSGNATTVRGFSGPRLVIFDEAAFGPTSDELYHAVTPMLAGGGRFIAMSTPNGRRGWFYEAWEGGNPMWERTRIAAYDTPRLTPEFLEAERALKPDWRFRQEYLCEFVDTEDQVFASADLAAMLTPAVTPLFSQPFQW